MRDIILGCGRAGRGQCSFRQRRRSLIATPLVALLIAGSACSATDPSVSAGDGTAIPAAGQSGLGAEGNPGEATDPASASGQAPGASGAASNGAGAVGGTGGVPGVSGAGPVVSGPPGVGVTETTVNVGAFELKNGAEFLAAFGVKGGAGLDTRAAQNAIVSYINAHGGLGGRRVEPVYHALDATSTDTYAAIAQAACADFTEDHKVFAVVAAPFQMVPCLAKHGVVALNNADQAGDDEFLAKYASIYYAPSSLGYERKANAWVGGLAMQGFLTKGKFGLLYYDVDGMPGSVVSSLRPAMRAQGVTFAREIEIPFPRSTSDAASTVSAIQSAVLRFKTEGIDHVMLYDVNGTMPTFFMKEADSQLYTPLYGLNSDSHLEFTNANVPHSQLRGAVGVGWRPSEDVTEVKPANRADTLCREIMTKAGVKLPDSATAAAAVTLCDLWFFLKDGFNGAAAPNAGGFRAAVDALGTTWMSPRTYATHFARGRAHDGVAAVGNVSYRDGCSCWQPAGSLRPIS